MPATAAIDVVREFWRLMASNDFHATAAVLAPEFVLEWPQSGERIHGPRHFAQMNQDYPAHGPWRFTIHRLFGSATEVVSDVAVTDGVQAGRALSLFTVDGGRIVRLVEFWPEPFEAPAWRAHLVERIA